MFGFVQWDDPVTLLLEVLLSLAIVVGLVVVVRRVNAKAAADRGTTDPTSRPPEDHEAQ